MSLPSSLRISLNKAAETGLPAMPKGAYSASWLIRVPYSSPEKIKTGAGWRVRATWPNGQFENIGAFRSKKDAIRWIAEQSEVWLGSPLAVNRPPRKRPRDFSQAAKLVVDIASGRIEDRPPTHEERGKDPAAAALGRKGGKARAERLSAKKRSEIARQAARKRWR
jgi:hypothetical protein